MDTENSMQTIVNHCATATVLEITVCISLRVYLLTSLIQFSSPSIITRHDAECLYA